MKVSSVYIIMLSKLIKYGNTFVFLFFQVSRLSCFFTIGLDDMLPVPRYEIALSQVRS